MNNAVDFVGVWNRCLEWCKEYVPNVKAGDQVLREIFEAIPVSREEDCLHSHFYMPRGFYCPSPDLELRITNIHRGKIAKYLKKTSKPTHHYLFDMDGKMHMAKVNYYTGAVATEYIFHEGDITYGAIFSEDFHGLHQFNIERRENGKTVEFLHAVLYQRDKEFHAFSVERIMYEICNYEKEGFLETEMYDLDSCVRIQSLGWGQYSRCRYALDKEGKIIPDSQEYVKNVKERVDFGDGIFTV